MRFRFQGRDIERRQASFTDEVVRHIVEKATGEATLDINGSAAVVTAAGLLGRCFSGAEVSPDSLQRGLNSSVLFQIGQALVFDGEWVGLIRVDADGIKLERASSWDITTEGGQWSYTLTLPGPDSDNTEKVGADSVFHPRINVPKSSPHKGLGMAAQAGGSALILSAVERVISNELTAASGWLLPTPEGVKPADLAAIKADLVGLKGRASMVPSMSSSWGQGRSVAPGDWTAKRMGGDPPPILNAIRSALSPEILAACGVPGSMFSPRNATAAREGFRQYVHTVVQPVADVVLVEAREKLLPDVGLDFTRLAAADVQGRARSAKSLVDAGFSLKEAAVIVGFQEPGA